MKAPIDPFFNTGAIIAGASTATNAYIMQDATYIILGCIGGAVSVLGILIEYNENRLDGIDEGLILLVLEVVKGFILGGLFTLITFIGMSEAGDALIHLYFGIEVRALSGAFWYALSVLLSFYSIKILDWIALAVNARLNKKKERDE